MCRACDGRFPDAVDHRALSDAAKALRLRVASGGLKSDSSVFVREITKLDRMRFAGPAAAASPEWGQPQTAAATRRYIFAAKHPHALTLFVLSCWYDAQEQYVVVWSRRLALLSEWVESSDKTLASLPGTRSGPWTRSIAWKTWQECASGGFGLWLAKSVNEIAESNGGGAGNTWRLVGRLARELTQPGQTTRGAFASLEHGVYAAAMFKRAWMLAMFLRRDQGIIRCLVERSLSRQRGGAEAIARWYDDEVFPQTESELPVDQRMLAIGQEIFGPDYTKVEDISWAAHQWGQRHGLPPSVLDVLFFAMD